jgi:hypothetical protein
VVLTTRGLRFEKQVHGKQEALLSNEGVSCQPLTRTMVDGSWKGNSGVEFDADLSLRCTTESESSARRMRGSSVVNLPAKSGERLELVGQVGKSVRNSSHR